MPMVSWYQDMQQSTSKDKELEEDCELVNMDVNNVSYKFI